MGGSRVRQSGYFAYIADPWPEVRQPAVNMIVKAGFTRPKGRFTR
jgi:hypothetical protein